MEKEGEQCDICQEECNESSTYLETHQLPQRPGEIEALPALQNYA